MLYHSFIHQKTAGTIACHKESILLGEYELWVVEDPLE